MANRLTGKTWTNTAQRWALGLLIGLIAALCTAQAATITVDTDLGNDDRTDGACSFREAMIEAGSEGSQNTDCAPNGMVLTAPNTIEFDSGYTIVLESAPGDVTNELIIDGGTGVTLDGSGGSGSFPILRLPGSGSNLTFNDLTFQNAGASAIQALNSSSVVVGTASSFEDNTANNGAAINSNGTLTLTGVNFTGNQANNDGGAIQYSGDQLTITGCNFGLGIGTGNMAERGGALFINQTSAQGDVLTITGSIFAFNIADGSGAQQGGGAIWANTDDDDGTLFAIVATQFIENEAPNGQGGAILLPLGSRLGFPSTISGEGDLTGGGIFSSQFFGNTAGGPAGQNGSGGAIFNRGRLTVVATSFIDNESTLSRGGAISSEANADNTLLANVTFSGNTAETDGGAIYNQSGTNIQLINATIDGNSANGAGGGLFNDNTTATDFSVQNSILSNNSGGNCAGEAVSNSGNNLQFNPAAGCGDTAFDTGDPALDAPTINLGPNVFVLTMALNDNSAAQNAGDNATCSGIPVFNLDARGLVRPAGQVNCDLGAYESDFDPAELDATPNAGLAFNMIETGTTSMAMTATIENIGGSPATNLAFVTSAEFVIAGTGSCTSGQTLGVGATCTVDVSFAPTADGMQTGMLTVSEDGGSMDAIPLSGTGFTPASLDVTPDAGLMFASVEVGMSTASMTATISNPGGLDAVNLGWSFMAEFADATTGSCTMGQTLMGGASCTVDIVFSPTAAGQQMGSLMATADGNLMDAISLVGTGLAPAALDVTPDAGLMFGMVQSGTSSAAMTATVSNPGQVAASNLGWTLSMEFTDAGTGTCTMGQMLAAGANCSIDIVFSPTADGAQTGSLMATADGGLMDAIALTGTGFTPAGLDVTPDGGLAFGMVQTGSTSGAMTATVTNTGGSDAVNLAWTLSMEFTDAGTGTCVMAQTLTTGSNCTIDVVFSPTADGMQTGSLMATADGGLMDAIALTGTGFTPAGLDVTPDAGLMYGMVQTGSTSGAMTATVTNTGGSDAVNLAWTLSMEFTDAGTGTCVMAQTLTTGSNCTIDVVFSPTADGMQTGSLMATADGGLMDVISLTGTGFTPAGLDVTPDGGLAFGMIQTGMTSAAMTATVTNTGGSDAVNLAWTLSMEFTDAGTGTCVMAQTLTTGSNCTIDVVFSPTADGMQTGSLMATADGGLMDAISLTGTGFTPAGLDVTPDGGLAFGMVQTGSTSGAMTATVTNTGGSDAVNLAWTLSMEFTDVGTGSCTMAQTLTTGSNCTIDVVFSPTADGMQTGSLMATADGGLMDAISLTGTGFTPAGLDVTPDGGLAFGMIQTGMTSAAMTATVTNSGGSDAVNLAWTLSMEFTDAGTGSCVMAQTLTTGSTCTIDVVFSPTADGAQTGSLTATADGGLMDAINLTGTAVAPGGGLTPGPDVNLGNVTSGTQSGVVFASIQNTGLSSLMNLSFALTGEFIRDGGTCGLTLAPGASCTIGVRFVPTMPGPQTGTLTITADGGAMAVIGLSGVGIAGGPMNPISVPALHPVGMLALLLLVLAAAARQRRQSQRTRS